MFRRERVSPLQFLMLLQLKEGAKYGYEVLKALRKQFKDVWEPKTGTIYPALRSLEARGFVKTEVRKGKDFYSLTERGDALLDRIGERLESELKFGDRYYDFVAKWMSRPMKDKVVDMLRMLADEDVWPPIFIERLLDDAMDRATKLEILESIRKLLDNRLKVVGKMIEDLEGG